ncbi:diguanylate cyclase [Marinobacter sp. M1N3S26]|uniref:sensor domain-containing diguanylate cyclase n=1 Tax=unclassified Marinobacter TaxID=83889 RepID=UPI00387ABFCB
MEQPPIDMNPFNDFESASRAVLRFLHDRIDMGLWMMTRTEGHDWIVLQADDHRYGVEEGTVFQWVDSYCSRMARGEGPRVAPNASEVAVYAEAPINEQIEIGAYIGVPVCRNDGSLFGTLCAIDPSAKRESMENELPLVELLGKLLGTVLSSELLAVDIERALEKSRREATTDDLTGLVNRRGWGAAIEAEEARAGRYGSPTSIMIVDVDGLKEINDTQGHAQGDDLLCRVALALKDAVRESDLVARLGGDEFGVMAVECGRTELDSLLDRVRSSFARNGVAASIGTATRDPKLGLLGAISDADRQMYVEKTARRRKVGGSGGRQD